MKRTIYTIWLMIAATSLFLESCQEQQTTSPLENMVNDYIAQRYPSWVVSNRRESDTLFLHVRFLHTDYYPLSYFVTDSTVSVDVVASVGGTMNRMVYPNYPIATPPLPPPPMPEMMDETGISNYYANYDNFEKSFSVFEKEVYGKDSVIQKPEFSDLKECFFYWCSRYDNLYKYVDSLYMLDPTLIGYTYFGQVQVIILAEKNVDRSIVDAFLQGVNIMDLRPRYIWHKQNEEKLSYCGWGSFNVYDVDSVGNFRQVGLYAID